MDLLGLLPFVHQSLVSKPVDERPRLSSSQRASPVQRRRRNRQRVVRRSYPCVVTRRAETTGRSDPVIVAIHEERPAISRIEWLRLLETDGQTDVDAQAAEIIRELRERCEGADAGRR